MKPGNSQPASRLKSALKKLLPRSKSRMGACTLILFVLWVLSVFQASTRIFPAHPWTGILPALLSLLLLIPAGYYLWRLYNRVKSGLLWKIRRRLILVYVFVGAIPVIIIAGIFYISAVLVYYQFSYFLIFKQIGIHSSQVHAFTLSLREGLQQMALENPYVSPEQFRQTVDAESRYLLSAYPSASIVLNYEDPMTGGPAAYISHRYSSAALEGYRVPEWIDGDFSSLVLDEEDDNDSNSRLLLRSFVPSVFPSDSYFSLEVTVPFDGYIMERLKAALGQNLLLTRYTEDSVIRAADNVLESTFEIEDDSFNRRFMLPIPLFPISWSSGEELEPFRTDSLMVEVSFAKLLSTLQSSDSAFGRWIYNALLVITIIFIIAEAASITLGFLLTRSITQAIHNLDKGTQYVKRGDFSHRIDVRSQDQLGALTASFNQMTEYVQQLVKERVQKERLEREIEIARNVQERLFPDGAPRMKHMEIAGACLPARMVSGDYYDFLPLGEEDLGLAVGDISGKGISAALLMASLQAALHSNVMHLHDAEDAAGERNVAGIVERLNRQIYNYTGTNRFATFFYAHYDGNLQTMVYCNAGHNPPLHFHGDECRRLNAGGTVVGIFPEAIYEQETLRLKDGDLIVAYTDGLTECADMNGEEFGEERLIQLIRGSRNMPVEDMKKMILENVLAWKSTDEQDDDITLIIARLVGGI
jgi:sigma-B regulation protein RsbU (phosphoserine phosphatase)